MNATQLADLINRNSHCWAIENQNRTGGPESIDCPDVSTEDIDDDDLSLARNPEDIDDVAGDAVLRAFQRSVDAGQYEDCDGLTRDWVDTASAESDGFVARVADLFRGKI